MQPPHKALIIVDVQNDFCKDGALEVPDADAIVPLINHLMVKFRTVVATIDYHPVDHCSFASSHPGSQVGDIIDLDGVQQQLWPDHCIGESYGCELHGNLLNDPITTFIVKGINPAVDSYSAFRDNADTSDTGLADWLTSRGVTDVVIVGLALEYCVKYTALDAVSAGFDTTVLVEATRAVNVNPGDDASAIEEMRQVGIRIGSPADYL